MSKMMSGNRYDRRISYIRNSPPYRRTQLGYVKRADKTDPSLVPSLAEKPVAEELLYDLPETPRLKETVRSSELPILTRSTKGRVESFDMLPPSNPQAHAIHHTPDGAHYHSAPIETVASSPLATVLESAPPLPVADSGGPKRAYKDYFKNNIRLGDLIAKRLRAKNTIIYSMAAVVFLFGVGVSTQALLVNHQADTYVKAASSERTSAEVSGSEASSEPPSETSPSSNDVRLFSVAPSAPRIISIPKLNIQARVLAVGVDQNNELQTPKNIHDTAWYTGSAEPGKQGAMLINGHSSGVTMPGIFKNLKQLKVGDEIEVERGDGKMFSFSVKQVSVVSADKVDMAQLLASKDPSKPGLNLITCGGKFDKQTNRFEDRVLVYAVQN